MTLNAIFRYKRAGCSVGPIAGKRDGYESFSVCPRSSRRTRKEEVISSSFACSSDVGCW